MVTTATLWQGVTQVNITDEPEPGANMLATNRQANSTVVSIGLGQYLVVWEDSSTKFDFGLEPRAIVGQIFGPTTARIGTEFVGSATYSDLDQQQPSVATYSAGDYPDVFAVAYQTPDAAFFGDGENITIEVFGGPNNDRIATYDLRQGNGGPAINEFDPTVTALADGSLMVFYESDGAGNLDIVGQVISTTGTIGAAFAVTNAAGNETAPEVVALGNGNALLLYRTDTGASDIQFSIFNPLGVQQAQGAVANTAGAETGPAVAVLSGGGFVVAWTDANGDGAGNSGVKFRLYSDAGVAEPAQSANVTTTAGVQSEAAITALLDGGFVVAWTDAASGTIQGQRFDASGSTVGSQITLISADNVSDASITTLSDGRFIVTATDELAGDFDIVSAIWDPRESVIIGTAAADALTARLDGAVVNGLAGADFLYGYAGNDTLDGGADIDTMQGGAGNDTYVVDNAGDIVDESTVGAGGIDLVRSSISFSLADAVHALGAIENLSLLGSANLNVLGNALNNVLGGNSGSNTLNGGAGADNMRGGGGNDVYVVDNAGDIVDESIGGGAGIDYVRSTISFSLADTVHAKGNIENVILLGSANLSALGNALANTLTGNTGTNTLNGGAGADTMLGGAGNDTYVVDNAGDKVDESVAGSNGVDLVRSTVSFNLASASQALGSIENVTLIGAASINAFGNALGNTLIGNTGVNLLAGGLGNDNLTSGAGNDVFLFNTALNAATNLDTITDMNELGNDTIRLENAIFTALPTVGALAAGAFHIGTAAVDADDRIIYNSVNGQLSYDSDGNGANTATLFAILDPGLVLTAADFYVV